jgi:phosphate transport system ATP-binding protein
MAGEAERMSAAAPKIVIRALDVRYGAKQVVRNLDLAIDANAITAIIGPAGSGKTSLLRTITLLSVDVDRASVGGEIRLDGRNLLDPSVDRADLRRRVGMVFATPQPLPGSIYDNLVYGPRLAGTRRRAELDSLVESSLRAAELWDEVRDRLHRSAFALSGGQQQRLCIARTIALRPEVILLDEPCSGLDPISTLRIEEMMRSLALSATSHITWVLVTNNTKQAARVSQRTAFLLMGELVEEGPTPRLFTNPRDSRTGDYVEGRFG